MAERFIIANWKMNPATLKQARRLFQAAEKASRQTKATVVVCPPFLYAGELSKLQKHSLLGAQDCSFQDEGPLTGEVSGSQLRDIGCSFVIVGHSERKKYLKETPAMTAGKARAATRAGLRVVLCAENANELRAHRKKLRSFKDILVVYEPSSAISTQGAKRVAPASIAKTAKEFRKIAGRGVQILYGGSVGASSAKAIFSEGGVDGILVGSASLNPGEFSRLVKAVLIV